MTEEKLQFYRATWGDKSMTIESQSFLKKWWTEKTGESQEERK